MIAYDTGSAEPTRKRIDVRWVVIGAGALAAALALALGLVFGLSASRFPVNARSIVSGDGYKIIRTLSPAEVHTEMAQDKSQDGQMAASMISGDAAAGIKGDQAEAAVGISDTGKTLLPPLLAIAAASEKDIRIRVDGNYLVISGPASKLAGNPFANLGNG